MKNTYRFFFDENEDFLAELIEDGMTYYLSTKNALDELITINNMKFTKIRLKQKSIFLENDENEITIKNVDQFIENGLFAYIPNIFSKLRKETAKYMKKLSKNLTHENKQNGCKKIIVGGMAILMLGSTASLLYGLKQNNTLYAEEIDNDLNNFDLEKLESDKEEFISKEHIENLKKNFNIQNTISTPKENTNELDENGYKVYLNFELTNDLEKKENVYNSYHEIGERFANKWGMSPNIPISILTQETGGMETNLMKIEFKAWANEPIKVYNFNDNRYDYFILTNNPTEEEKQKYTIITEKDLKNPITNISIGCVLLRKSAEYTDYHVLAAITCYNLGPGNMEEVLDKTIEETGQSREEILSDQENLSFYQYTHIPGEGDPLYLSHVFAFLDDYGEVITFKHFDEKNEIVEEQISIYSNKFLH